MAGLLSFWLLGRWGVENVRGNTADNYVLQVFGYAATTRHRR